MSLLPIQLPLTIISGGQTGADLGGLVAAQRCGIWTTGWAPQGYRTEAGKKLMLRDKFHLVEHGSPKYPPRTIENIREADLTLIFSPNATSAGTVQTVNACIEHQKAHVLYADLNSDTVSSIVTYLRLLKPAVINIAGNRESVQRGLASKTAAILTPALLAYQHDIAENGLVTTRQHDAAALT